MTASHARYRVVGNALRKNDKSPDFKSFLRYDSLRLMTANFFASKLCNQMTGILGIRINGIQPPQFHKEFICE